MELEDSSAYCQPEASTRTVLPAGIRSILFENLSSVQSRNTRPGVLDVDSKGVWRCDLGDTAVHGCVYRGSVAVPTLPEEWVAPDFNHPVPGSKFAGIL